MGMLKTNFKYKIVKNFLSEEEIEIGKHYLLLLHKNNITNFDLLQNNNGDSFFQKDPFTETILIKKLKIMEKETGLKLIPTYSFSRVYSYNACLEKHKDREACEVSVSIMWGSDGTSWPIFIDGNKIEMSPGDGVIYLGCELEHWREYFKGDWHAQSFLHYVDFNGPYKKFAYDQRNFCSSPEISYSNYIKNFN